MSRRELFERDGYVAVESFLSADEVATCLREVGRYVDEVVPGLPAEHVFYEDKEDTATLKQLQRMHEHDTWFGEFFAGKPQRLAEELLGTAVVGKNLQFFNKPPNVDGRHPLHQDLVYFPFRPIDKMVASQTALEPMTRERGCLSVVLIGKLRFDFFRRRRIHRSLLTLQLIYSLSVIVVAGAVVSTLSNRRPDTMKAHGHAYR